MNQLTGLRFILSLHILFSHTIPTGYSIPGLNYLKNSAGVSTSLFIILSGYSLSYVYSKRTIDYKQFIYRRSLKLYPLHLMMILLYAILVLDVFIRGKYGIENTMVIDKNHFASLGEFLVSIFSQIFTVDSWNPFYFGINYPGWTLSCLFFCYLLFPSILKKSEQKDKTKLLLSLFILSVLIMALPTIIILLGYNDEYMKHATTIYSFPSFLYGLLHRNPIIRLPEFVIGILLFRLFEQDQTGKSSLKIYGLIVIIIAIMFLIGSQVPFAFIHNGFFIPLEICFIWVLITRDNYIPKFLSRKTMLLLGNMSFSLYLLHMPLYVLWSRADKVINKTMRFGTDWFYSNSENLRINQLVHSYTPNILSYLVFLISTIAISLFVQKYIVNAFYAKYKTNPGRFTLNYSTSRLYFIALKASWKRLR